MQLIAAINHNNPVPPGDLKNMLLNALPLSDTVLLTFIHRKISTPPGIFKEVMLPNSPVSDAVILSLNTKLASLPPGIAEQIKSAQASAAYRTLTAISQDIATLQQQRGYELYTLLTLFADSGLTQQAMDLLTQEGTTNEKQILLATYIADSNLTAAAQTLAGMMPSTPDELAYMQLQGMLLQLAQDGRSVYDMTSSEIDFVRSIAYSAPSNLASANAQAILKLLFGEEAPLIFPTADGTLRMQNNVIPNEVRNLPIFYLGQNIPNPLNNTTTIPYLLPDGIEKAFINVYDITGKLISANEVNSKNNRVVISANDFENGIYIYKLESNGKVFGSKKMIIIKE